MRPIRTLEMMMIHACVVACLAAIGPLQPVPAQCQNNWTLNPPPLFPTNEWGPVTNNCQLGLRFPKLEYQVGEQVLAAVYLRNVGERQIGHTVSAPDRDYEVIVKGGDGQSVPYTESWARVVNRSMIGVIGGSAHSEELAPHQQEYPSWLDITKRYRMEQTGTYIVTVKGHMGMTLAAPQEANATNLVATVELFSNPVMITVVAPKPKQ